MGKFSTGVLTGAILGMSMLFIDKRTIKKAKRMMHKMPHRPAWM